jgi:type II restriction enzyme
MSLNLEPRYRKITLEEYLDNISSNGWYWIAKRLSGNDTGVTGGHQVGIYYPKFFFEKNFKEICTIRIKNPDSIIDEVYFPNEDFLAKSVRAIYYNNKFTEQKQGTSLE